jgi:DNA-binding winged helix-turn-helix (wHTH) protein
MNDMSVLASDSKDATFVFGACELDRASARIRRAGRVVPMAPKAYDVLLYLIQHAGRLVTKNELFEAVWPGVFVGDAALKVCIREIRKALEDDAHEPQYIETAHRRGYRFIAPISIKSVEPAAAARSTDRAHESHPTSISPIRSWATVRSIWCSSWAGCRTSIASGRSRPSASF